MKIISALTKATSKEINVCSMSKILQDRPIRYYVSIMPSTNRAEEAGCKIYKIISIS